MRSLVTRIVLWVGALFDLAQDVWEDK